MVIYVSILVALGGAILYGFTNGKAAEIGRLAFACGLLAFLLRIGPLERLHLP